MESTFMAALLADAGLVALVGGAGAARIHWHQLPQRQALPAVILHLVATGPIQHTQKGRVVTQDYVVQLDCWAGTLAAALELRAAVLAVLDGLKGDDLKAFPEGLRTDWEPAGGPDASGSESLYRASIDARLWHFPTV